MLIRSITPEDKSQWLPLWTGYQDFYKTRIADAVTDLTWDRFFDESVPMHALIVEEDKMILGFVHFIYHYSTWTNGPYVYLQDLFTVPELRGRGVATALINAVYDAAKKAGTSRVYWLTHESNSVGISLYNKLAENSGFIQFRKNF